jgi:hypothetical protein
MSDAVNYLPPCTICRPYNLNQKFSKKKNLDSKFGLGPTLDDQLP